MTMQTMPTPDKMVFRKTNQHLGRRVSVTPGNSTNRHLSYGRIRLNESEPSVAFNDGGQETALICLSGKATVKVLGKASGPSRSERSQSEPSQSGPPQSGPSQLALSQFDLAQYDSIYIPRDSDIEVTTGSEVDFAEFSADVDGAYPLQVVRYSDLSKDPSLKFTTGTPGQQRHLNICVGKNVEAGRLLVGFTFSEPGNWTSWPPHEHGQMLEEMYVYFNMPAPAYGLQLVYNNTEYPELVVPVRDGDAVLMPAGYHPNVAVPGHSIGFLWAMAAHREKVDRQFGVVNVQPGFDKSGSGLEASRK
jgi:5-deoxy-glucuronate isomerase